jgi:signal transduction histidine kinase
MNPYAIPPLITNIIIVGIGLFVFLRNRKAKLNIIFSFFSLILAIWLSGYAMMYLSKDGAKALSWGRIGFLGIIFIPILSYHFIISFLNLKRKILLRIIYLLAIPSILLSRTNYIYNGIKLHFWGYYPTAGKIYFIFLIMFTLLFTKGVWLLFAHLKKESGIKKEQIKYVCLGFVIGMLGIVDYLIKYPIFNVYPYGYICALAFYSIITYAALKYRLMDIRVAVTRTGIFIAVYTLVLGVPFAVALGLKAWLIENFSQNWWMLPLGLMALLATVGPFIYIYIQRKAEERLHREQRRYQDVLKQASLGMTRIRDLRKLLSMITHIVTKTVRIAYIAIYLYNREADEYILVVSRDKGRVGIPKLTPDNPLVNWIVFKREPLIYEEIKLQMLDSGDATYTHLEKNMRLLTASVVIPSFLEDRFMGFIVLGDKISGQMYTAEDLNVFQVLASQAALAIENAQFYDETKKMQEQIAHAEKMATIGTMADGLSHQINNRFYALSLIAGDTIDTIKMTNTSKCTPEVKEMIGQINHALERVKVNVMQGAEVVKGMLKYSRPQDKAFETLTLDQIIDGTLDMVQYKVRLSEIDIVRDYSRDIPKIKGNLAQLIEVFFNFIDNAYDAIVERRELLKEEGYRGKIVISVHPKIEESILEIIVADNGIGIKEQESKKIFTPFFTTKTSSRKGTGLGLYVIRRIITELHKGKITFESEYKTGTRFILELTMVR